MMTPTISVTLLVACLPVLCLCEALAAATPGDAGQHFGTHEAGFSAPNSEAGFQSWEDWLAKRSFGSVPFGDTNSNKLQEWKEWMKKRNMLHPGSAPQFGSSQDQSAGFQQWKDWMDKRSFGNSGVESFKGAPGSQAQFQTWTDWMSKRGMGLGGATGSGNMFRQPSGGKFQTWADFSKKAMFGQAPEFGAAGGLQPWHMYQKRFGNGRPSNPFAASSFEFKPNMMKWDEMFKKSSHKRQLGHAPAGFGHYREYFTNGLQDWRNTFQNSKRPSRDAKNTKQDNN